MNTEKICRCCLALDVPLLSIYEGGSAGMGCVADMLKQIAKLKPQCNDNMPEKACLQCISEINRCYVFKMKCENSNRTLRQLLPEAVPEPLDYKPKEVVLCSASVQTEDKIFVTSVTQTETAEKPPLLIHSSVQTKQEDIPEICHKEIQTEYIINVTELENVSNSSSISENIIIYNEKPIKSKKRPANSPPKCKRLAKKPCEENSKENTIIIEENDVNSQPITDYILLEDSNMDSNYTDTDLYKPKDFEFYDSEEVQKSPEDEQKILNPDNEYDYQEVADNNHLDLNNCEESNKTSQETEEITNKIQKSSSSTRASCKPKGQYQCTQCIMTFVSIKVLKRHLANRHDIKDVEFILNEEPIRYDNSTAKLYSSAVDELSAETVAKPQLMPREKTTPVINEEVLTNIKYFCEYCQAGFAQRKTLTYHMKHQVCMANNFKCNKCERIFISEENLEVHKLTHENPHKCLECDTVCKTIEELSQHMIDSHNRSARNQCHVCKKVFTMKTSLIDHLRIHSGEKPFLCTICGKSFRQNSNLRQHLIRHTNEKNFKCDICPNAYVTKAELFSHKRTHTGDQPFKCDICQARFTTSCSLQKHKRKHTGERPYACEFCPMRFAALNVLKNHRRIHTGEKPYKCNYCPKSFTQKGDCLMHERAHVDNIYKCVCKTKFSKKSNFRHHLKTQHPDLSEHEIQALLDKSSGGSGTKDNENEVDTEYQITLMDNSHSGDENLEQNVQYDEDEVFVTISQNDTRIDNVNSNNAEEDIMEIVMEDVM